MDADPVQRRVTAERPVEPAPTWEVWRQDDNGNRFRVEAGLPEARARQLAAELEARGHKQMYWAQPSPGAAKGERGSG